MIMRMNPDLVKARQKAYRALKKLRKDGFLILPEHMCCPSCALYDIQKIVDTMPASKLAQVQGCVHWSTQEKARMKDYGLLVLHYCGVTLSDGSEVGLSTVDVGKAVVSALRLSGNTVEWDGKQTSCIHVILLPPKQNPV